MPEPLFNKVPDLYPEILLNERLHHGYFSMKFAKFLFQEHPFTGRLLLISRKLDIQTFNARQIC